MRTNVGGPGPARSVARGLLVAASLLAGALPLPASSAGIAPYQAIVPLAGTAETDRAAAIGEALKVAAVRASGRPEAASSPRVVAAAGDPAGYVQQYSMTADRMLKVSFDPRSMEQLLQQAGLPVWPAERPTVMVLLFTPGVAGGARAVTAGERPSERVELERAAHARGVPLAWPRESLDPASARSRLGTTGASLLGVGAGGSFEWVFVHAGQASRAQGSLRGGADLAGDALAARYAPASTRSVSMVKVRIGGLHGVRDYAALTRYLEDLSLVRAVNVRELQRDSVQFDLELRGDLALLRRVLALDGRLAPAREGLGGATGAVDFVWQS
jgi:uncharacterized protein